MFKNKENRGIIITMIVLMILVLVEFGGMVYYKTKWKQTENQLVKIQSEK